MPLFWEEKAHNWNVNGVSNVLLGSSLNLFGDVQFRTTDRYVDAYHVTCSIYADGSTTAITTVDGTSHGPLGRIPSTSTSLSRAQPQQEPTTSLAI